MRRIGTILLFTALCHTACAQYYTLKLDTQYPNQQLVLDRVFSGNTPYLRAQIYENGTVLDLTGWALTFRYFYGQYDTNGAVTINGTISSNVATFLGATNMFFEDRDDYYFSISGVSPGGYVKTFGRGRMIQEYDPATSTNLSTMMGQINVDWWSNNVGVLVQTMLTSKVDKTEWIGYTNSVIGSLSSSVWAVADSTTNYALRDAQLASNAVMLAGIASNAAAIVAASNSLHTAITNLEASAGASTSWVRKAGATMTGPMTNLVGLWVGDDDAGVGGKIGFFSTENGVWYNLIVEDDYLLWNGQQLPFGWSMTNLAKLTDGWVTNADFRTNYMLRVTQLASNAIFATDISSLKTNVAARLSSNVWASAPSTTNYELRTWAKTTNDWQTLRIQSNATAIAAFNPLATSRYDNLWVYLPSSTTTNQNVLAAGYTGPVADTVSYTGEYVFAAGDLYRIGATNVYGADYGTNFLYVGSVAVATSGAAGAFAGYFSPAATTTGLVLTMVGGAAAQPVVNGVSVQRITNGNLNVAGDVFIGGTIYGGIPQDILCSATSFVQKAGDAMSGNLNMGNSSITNVNTLRVNGQATFNTNVIIGPASTAAGKWANVIGVNNTADGDYSIAGGWGNWAASDESLAFGGSQNIADGQKATVVGGSDNRASGENSFAIGFSTRANHPGSFVWGDYSGILKQSMGTNTFNIWAAGGTYFLDSSTNTYLLIHPTSGVTIGTASFKVDTLGRLAAPWDGGGYTISNVALVGDGSGLTNLSATGSGFPLTSSVSAAWYNMSQIGTASGSNLSFIALSLSGAADLNGTLDVAGNADFHGDVTFYSNATYTTVNNYTTNTILGGTTTIVDTVVYSTNVQYTAVVTNFVTNYYTYTTNYYDTYSQVGGTWNLEDADTVKLPHFVDTKAGNLVATGTWDFTLASITGTDFVNKDGSVAMTGDLNMGGKAITNIGGGAGSVTGTPLYAESDPLWQAGTNDIWAAITNIQATAVTGAVASINGLDGVVLINGATNLDQTIYLPSGSGMDPATASNSFVAKTGDTMTGALTVGVVSVSSAGLNGRGNLYIYATNTGIALGKSANARSGGGVALGVSANAELSAAAMGYEANGYYYGVAVGHQSKGLSYGIGIGCQANGGYIAGNVDAVAIGYGANAAEGGVAVGGGFTGKNLLAYEYGVAVGYATKAQNWGTSIGANSYAINTNVALGYAAKAGSILAHGRMNMAIGAYSTAINTTGSIAVGYAVTNNIPDSARVRGSLYLDGATTLAFRTNFGSGNFESAGLYPHAIGGMHMTNLTYRQSIPATGVWYKITNDLWYQCPGTHGFVITNSGLMYTNTYASGGRKFEVNLSFKPAQNNTEYKVTLGKDLVTNEIVAVETEGILATRFYPIGTSCIGTFSGAGETLYMYIRTDETGGEGDISIDHARMMIN